LKFLLVYPPTPPQSDDKDEQRLYRIALHRWTFKVSLAVLTFGVVGSWAFTPWGFARADDIKAKVDEAIAPITAEVAQVKKQLTDINSQVEVNSRRLSLALANGIASELRFIQAKRCKEQSPAERDRLIAESDRKQDEYRELRGEYYRIPRCEDL